jgi:hypothetical protein
MYTAMTWLLFFFARDLPRNGCDATEQYITRASGASRYRHALQKSCLDIDAGAVPRTISSMPNGLDLIIVVPELQAFRDVLKRLEEIGGRAEIVLDRRQGERRRSESTPRDDEHRQGDRRVLDITEPIRGGGWVLIRADQRPPARE